MSYNKPAKIIMRIHTICILGGTGFVGRNLINRLTAAGYRVRILTRHRERHRDLLVLPTLSVTEADIHDVAVLSKVFSGCDAVINLVGILNEKGRKGKGFRQMHVELSRKVVQACLASGVQRLLHMSALNADADKGPSHYLRSKGEGENIVHAAQGLHVTSFRPSVIFGPDDSFFNRFAALLKKIPAIFPLACPEARFAPVYVDDVTLAFTRALNHPTSFGQRYDLCGPQTYTLKQLVEYTTQTLGLRRNIIGLGNALSRLQGRVFEWLPGKPFSYDNYLSLQVDCICPGDNFPAWSGVQPTALETVVPSYLRAQHSKDHYNDYRNKAYYK